MRSVIKARTAKSAVRAFALFVTLAVAASAAFSIPSSAKVIENIFSNTQPETAAFKASAGAASGASTRAQAQERADADEEGGDDADLPAFMAGKIDKEEYLRRREEHINKLRR